MKYFLSLVFTLLITASSFAQRSVHFEADLVSNRYDQTKMQGISLQLDYLSRWTISTDFTSGSGAVRNLPSAYKGPKLAENFNVQSISLGRMLNLDPEGKAWLSGKVGMHIGSFTGYTNFAPPPPQDPSTNVLNDGPLAVLLFPFLLIDAIINRDADHYSYTRYSQKLSGANAELMLNVKIGKHGVLGIGSKYVHNQQIDGLSFSLKAGAIF